MRHFVLPGKNAVLQSPLENFQIRQTLRQALCQVPKDDDEPSHCESSSQCHPSQIEGLRLHAVSITRYVIGIKKHYNNRIEIIEIESNRKEYES